jgi:hypothetical protein
MEHKEKLNKQFLDFYMDNIHRKDVIHSIELSFSCSGKYKYIPSILRQNANNQSMIKQHTLNKFNNYFGLKNSWDLSYPSLYVNRGLTMKIKYVG